MKKMPWIAVFSLTCLPNLSAAEIPAASKITDVTVYEDRALVTRRAEVELPPGASSIVFEGLPPGLDENSLRADGQGTGKITIEGVELKKSFIPGESNPRVAAIAEELEKLNYEMRSLQLKSAALHDQKQFLDSTKQFSSVEVSKDLMTKNMTAAEWSGLSQFMLESYTELGQKLVALEKAVQDKNKEIQAKQRELAELQSGQRNEKKTAAVNVDAASAGRLRVALTYLVQISGYSTSLPASWNISYDAKVYPEKNSASLVSYGNVRQSTGEDWVDVKLTLSSAKPVIGGRMPELSPWFVDFYQIIPFVKSKAVSRMAMMEPRADQAVDALAGAVAPAVFESAPLAQAAVSQNMGSVTYEIQRPATILSDNRFYKTPVKTEDFEIELDYEATPKLSPYAFIHSKIANGKDHPIPAGETGVFVNDGYVGRSYIETVGRGESFDLYLGIDPEVKIERTELVDKTKKALLGLKVRKDYGYKVKMENYKKENIRLTVIDQLPVSKNADIKSELVLSSLKPTKTEDLGILKWTFELAPAEKKDFEFQFFVEYPSDKNVSGI